MYQTIENVMKYIRHNTEIGHLFRVNVNGMWSVGTTKAEALENAGKIIPTIPDQYKPFVGTSTLIVGLNKHYQKMVPKNTLGLWDIFCFKHEAGYSIIGLSRSACEIGYMSGDCLDTLIQHSICLSHIAVAYNPTKTLWLINWIYRQPKEAYGRLI